MHSEGHAVAHLIGVLPIPGDFAGPGIQVVASHVVINSSLPSALPVLMLKEADYTCGKLKEELNGEEESYNRYCDPTCSRERTKRVVAEAKVAESGSKIFSASAEDAFLLKIFYSIAN